MQVGGVLGKLVMGYVSNFAMKYRVGGIAVVIGNMAKELLCVCKLSM